MGVMLQLLFSMVVDDLSSIVHAAVADLDGVVVKYFPQSVACWEKLVYQDKEVVSNILVDIFAIWGLYHRMSFRLLFLFFVGSVGS